MLMLIMIMGWIDASQHWTIIYGCESTIGYGSLHGDPYYGSGVLT